MPTFRDSVPNPLAVLQDRRPVGELTCGQLHEMINEAVCAAVGKPPDDCLITPEQLGKLCGVSRRCIDRWAADGVIPQGRLLGGARRWTRQQVLKFFRELAEAGEAERAKNA